MRTKEDRILGFRTCSSCAYDVATGEGERTCHYYACPMLPEELNVVCPLCLYNFFTGEGSPACGEPPSCAFALDEAAERLEMLARWLERVE